MWVSVNAGSERRNQLATLKEPSPGPVPCGIKLILSGRENQCAFFQVIQWTAEIKT